MEPMLPHRHLTAEAGLGSSFNELSKLLIQTTDQQLRLFAGAKATKKTSAPNQAMSQEQIWHLLTVAVYTADGDPQRQAALQQLSSIRASLLQPHGPANSCASFSSMTLLSGMTR